MYDPTWTTETSSIISRLKCVSLAVIPYCQAWWKNWRLFGILLPLLIREHGGEHHERSCTLSLAGSHCAPEDGVDALHCFTKMMKNLMPIYTMDPIPHIQQSQYSPRDRDVIWRIRVRTEKFRSSFYPNCLPEWNELCPEIRTVPSVAIFKKIRSRKFTPLISLSLELMTQSAYPISLNLE